MGVIFAELGDKESAAEKFKEAIDLSPDGEDYEDPQINLENLQ
jgi:predicted negative regulator of RcsB-dependent stress response